MITATTITITRAEGPTRLCGKTQTFTGPSCWDQASKWLNSQSYSFPRGGGYDKHDFQVVFADGETYEGRLDCQHSLCSDPDLDVAKHVYDFVTFLAGQKRPPHESEQEYERHLANIEQSNPGSKAGAIQWLQTYQIGTYRAVQVGYVLAEVLDDIDVLETLEASFLEHETSFVYTRDEYERAAEHLGELRVSIKAAISKLAEKCVNELPFLERIQRELQEGNFLSPGDILSLLNLFRGVEA